MRQSQFPSISRKFWRRLRVGVNGEFLLDLCKEGKRLKSKRAFEELANLFTEEDLKAILDSSRDFRERFALGSTYSKRSRS
jgi:hypothetical protein